MGQTDSHQASWDTPLTISSASEQVSEEFGLYHCAFLFLQSLNLQLQLNCAENHSQWRLRCKVLSGQCIFIFHVGSYFIKYKVSIKFLFYSYNLLLMERNTFCCSMTA